MRNAAAALLFFILVTTTFAQDAGDPGIGDDFYPALGNGGYDVKAYLIDLAISDDLREIEEGVVTITATATHDLSAFNLDFLGMTVDMVTVNGIDAPFTREGRELTITPAETLAEGQGIEIVVSYHGVPGMTADGDDIDFNNGWFYYDTGVLVASEPDGSAVWFPSNDHPLDKAIFRFVIDVPAPYVVAANGMLVGIAADDERITYTWDMDYPMATYLATVNIQTFEERADESESGVSIRNYFPQALADAGERIFARQGEMIDYFETVFGPYPFDQYGVVVADTALGFALETQTLTLFGKSVIQRGTSASGLPAESVIAHELAHQWFGDSLSLTTWRDIWLNEGFATYAQVLWAEHAYGYAVASQMLGQYYAQIRNPIFALEGMAAPADPPPDQLFNSSVYLRGGWTLHALRLHIGDEAFFTLLRTYSEKFKYGNVTTQDFIDLAVEVSGDASAAELLQAWLYEEGLPDVPQMGLFGTG